MNPAPGGYTTGMDHKAARAPESGQYEPIYVLIAVGLLVLLILALTNHL